MDERYARLRAIASGQDGQFATAQARELGVEPRALRWLRDSGETVLLRRRVWRFRVAAGEPDPAVTAYLLCWPHAVISHHSAALFHRLRPRRPAQPEITVPAGRRCSPAGVVVHVSRFLPRCDILRSGGLRYTSLARTVCDLADARDPWATLALLDDAVARGASPRWINQRAIVLANGRAGVALLRDATEPGSAAVFRSWLERSSAHVYRVCAFPDPEWNVPVHDDAGRIGIVDALWRDWGVISEKEGLRFHTTPEARRLDARRFNRLCDAGYRPRRFTWQDVVHRPVEMAATVLRALRAAGADLDPARLPGRIELPDDPFRR